MKRKARFPDGGYTSYIGSAAWRNSEARLTELAASRRRCRLCSRGEPEVCIEVHHNNYRRVGREMPSDLCALCSPCHALVTAELRKRRYDATELPMLRDVGHLLPGRTLIDSSFPAEDAVHVE